MLKPTGLSSGFWIRPKGNTGQGRLPGTAFLWPPLSLSDRFHRVDV